MGIVKKPRSIFSDVDPEVGEVGGRAVGLEVVGQRGGDRVAAAAEEQGVARAPAEALDVADEQQVVAARDGALEAAFEQGQAVLEDRAAAEAGLPGDAGELVGGGAREVVGDVALVGGQHVDREVVAALEAGQRQRGPVQAPEHERRVERDGGERVRGQALALAVGGERRDHGDARGEAAERVAELARVEGGRGRELAHDAAAPVMHSPCRCARTPAPLALRLGPIRHRDRASIRADCRSGNRGPARSVPRQSRRGRVWSPVRGPV